MKPLAFPVDGYKPDCSREGFLNEQEQLRKDEDAWRICRKSRRQPGFEKLMKLRYPGGKTDV